MKKFLLLLSFLSLPCLNVNTVFAQNGERNILNNETSFKNHLNVKSLTKFKNTKISLEKVADGIAFVPNILSLVGGILLIGVGGIKNKNLKELGMGISFILTSTNNLVKTIIPYKNTKHPIVTFTKDSVITICSLISTISFCQNIPEKAAHCIAILTTAHSLWHTIQEGKKVYQTIKLQRNSILSNKKAQDSSI